MQFSKFPALSLSIRALIYKKSRSILLIVLVTLIAITVSGGSILAYSLHNGIDSTKNRLGADAMIVPRGSEQDFEGALLQGSPETFYLGDGVADRIAKSKGIVKSSRQLFIATFSSDHCDVPAQVIGFDPKSDFVVAPWIRETSESELKDGEVILGYNVTGAIGTKLLLFGRDYTIAGKLDKTGMGFDTSVFINLDSAKTAVADYVHYAKEEGFPIQEDLTKREKPTSTLLIDIDDDIRNKDFATAVRDEFREDSIAVVLSQDLISSISENLGLAITILSVLIVIIWALSVIVLGIVFTLSLNERKREFGTLRALGATRSKLIAIILSESSIISFVGALIGTGIVALIVFPFNSLIEKYVSEAYLLPSIPVAIGILIIGFLLSFVLGPIASIFTAHKISGKETFLVIREGE
ncbi:MAG: FtsX-like permease family protein [Clostridiales Family XIII bacterium]|jgi:putative ABC transport system permease protein|nr:FtsX-like permease family protein [Clostridiales Family XIII bacterium]